MKRDNQEPARICPEICSRCKYHWELVLDHYEIPIDDDNRYGDYVLNEIHCVDTRLEDSLFGGYKVVANPLPIFENKFRLDKEIFTHCYEGGFRELYSVGSKKIILKPKKITKELKWACSNLIINEHQCPYYLEHLLKDWEMEEDRKNES